MGILIISGVVLAIAIMLIISGRQSSAHLKNLLKTEQERTLKLQQKIQSSQEEYRKNKEELERGKEALREARELSKKKLRKADNSQQIPEDTMMDNINNKVIEDSKKAVMAMESQIEQLKSEQNKSEELIRSELQSQSQHLESELKKKIVLLEEELKKQKKLMRPEGHKINLKTLPDEAASEFARVYRKAEQHERLHGIARAKLQLAQEKFSDLQRRYFEVCRELALAASQNNKQTPEL